MGCSVAEARQFREQREEEAYEIMKEQQKKKAIADKENRKHK